MTKGLAAGLLLTAGWGSDCGTRNCTDHWGPAEGPAPDPVCSGPVRWGRAWLALAAAAAATGVLMLVGKRRVNIPEGFML